MSAVKTHCRFINARPLFAEVFVPSFSPSFPLDLLKHCPTFIVRACTLFSFELPNNLVGLRSRNFEALCRPWV